jgi:hypothetical protein
LGVLLLVVNGAAVWWVREDLLVQRQLQLNAVADFVALAVAAGDLGAGERVAAANQATLDAVVSVSDGATSGAVQVTVRDGEHSATAAALGVANDD